MKARKTLVVIVVAALLATSLALGLGLGLASSGHSVTRAATDGSTLRMEVSGLFDVAIDKLSGVDWAVDVTLVKRVGAKGIVVLQPAPGTTSWGPIVVERAISGDHNFSDWAKLVATGKVTLARKNVTIKLYDADSYLVTSWSFVNCWPSAYACEASSPSWDDDSVYGPKESLTLQYEGFRENSPSLSDEPLSDEPQ